MEDPQRLDLQETGTRWDHYSELRELFACGIEILKNLNVKSTADAVKREKLEHAVEMLDGRIALLSDYARKTGWNSPDRYALREVIDSDVSRMFAEMKIAREEANESKAIKADDDSEGPETYTTK